MIYFFFLSSKRLMCVSLIDGESIHFHMRQLRQNCFAPFRKKMCTLIECALFGRTFCHLRTDHLQKGLCVQETMQGITNAIPLYKTKYEMENCQMYLVALSTYTVFDLITTHTPISAQSSNFIVFRAHLFKTNDVVSKRIVKTLIIKNGIYANNFCWKDMSSFCICKSYSHFFSKNTCEVDIILTRTVNILTTNELVKLTMLWTTGPRLQPVYFLSTSL